MKKLFTILVVAIAALASVSAAVISSPAATVNLTKNKVITMTQLNTEVQNFKNAGYGEVDPMEVLNALIDEVLIEQGAERDGYTISDAEVESLYISQKASVDQQAGRTLTNAEFEELVVESYGSVEDYKAYLKEQYVIQNYVNGAKGDIVKAVAEPTDKEIKAWYRQNAASTFAEPEMVRLNVIARQKTGDAAKDAETKKTLEGVYADIMSGKMTFERGVQLYTEDEASRSIGGDWGFLADTPSTRATMGDNFVEEAMWLEEGDVAGVFETPYLFVIVKCTVHTDPKILGLEDTISAYGVTVQEYIYQGLLYQNSELAFYNAYDALLADLRKQAKINIIYKK